MATPSTVGSAVVVDLLAALRALGLPVTKLCRAVHLPQATLRDPSARVPAIFVLRLLAEAERRTGDHLVGLHAGEHTHPRGPLAYLVISSPQLASGLRQVERFSRLAIHPLRVRVKRGAHAASVAFHFGDVFEINPHFVDYALMASLQVLRQAIGADFRLDEVHVRRGAHGYRAEAERAFGCPVRCKRTENSLVFASRYLDLAARGANPLIAAQLEKFAAALVARTMPPPPSRQAVADVTRSLLAEGIRADRTTAARRLHVSERTMQRRLEEEGTSFKAVRDAVLWEVVDALLSNRALTVKAVAFSVGFGDVAAFSKAFKRRQGCSPTEYRERLAAKPSRRQRLHAVGRSRG